MLALKNPRREAFCQLRVQGKTRDEAYRLAGYKPNRQNAARLTTKDDIKGRVAELQAELKQTYECTVEMMARQFDEDRAFAIACKAPSAAVAASVAKAKLFGLEVDRHTVNVTHNYALMSE